MAITHKCITLAACAVRLGSEEGAQQKTEDEVRLISARLATRPERRRYEEGD